MSLNLPSDKWASTISLAESQKTMPVKITVQEG